MLVLGGFFEFWRYDCAAIWGIGVSGIVVLMIIQCWIETGCRYEFCDNTLSYLLLGNGFLFVRVIKDSRTILGSDISALPVKRCWVMNLPEQIQKFIKGSFLGVIHNLRHFRMSCPT